MYKLEVSSGSLIKISESIDDFNDCYNQIHLRPYYLSKLGLNCPCNVIKARDLSTFNKLLDLVKAVNHFKPRDPIPNKKVDWVEPESSSVLIKRGDMIEIARRTSYSKTGPSIVPISDGKKYGDYGFFEDCARYLGKEGEVALRGNHRYFLRPGCPEYDKWDNWMKEKYYSFVGNKYRPVLKPTPVSHSLKDGQIISHIQLAYSTLDNEKTRLFLDSLANLEFCKINITGEIVNIYDRNGYFIMELAELEERDDGELINSIIDYLNSDELLVLKNKLNKFCI